VAFNLPISAVTFVHGFSKVEFVRCHINILQCVLKVDVHLGYGA
jgi:hypothetical protein